MDIFTFLCTNIFNKCVTQWNLLLNVISKYQPRITALNLPSLGSRARRTFSRSQQQQQQRNSASCTGPSFAPPHLQQRQVWVQVCEAMQDHRAAVLSHLQPHPIPNVPRPPRRVKHLDQLSRLDAARLGLQPRQIDHGCPRSRVLSHSDGSDISPVLPPYEAKVSPLLSVLRSPCWIIATVCCVEGNHDSRRGFSKPRPQVCATFKDAGNIRKIKRLRSYNTVLFSIIHSDNIPLKFDEITYNKVLFLHLSGQQLTIR